MADALLNAPFDLACGCEGMYDPADLVHRRHLQHFDLTSLGVDRYFNEVRGE